LRVWPEAHAGPTGTESTGGVSGIGQLQNTAARRSGTAFEIFIEMLVAQRNIGASVQPKSHRKFLSLPPDPLTGRRREACSSHG